MGKLWKFLHYHADRAWEGIWQAIVLWALALGGGPAFVWGLFKRLGASMDIALYAGILFALLAAMVVIFFRRHAKMMVIVKELQAKLPPVSSDSKTQPSPALVPRLQTIVVVVLGILVLVLVLLGLISGLSNTGVSQPAVSMPDAGTGPVAIFNGFDDVQKKILRTMWEHQSKMGYSQTWGLPIVTETPALPGFVLPEYVEFYTHLEPLVKQGYVSCRYWEQLKHKYCILVDSGIILMSSIGDLIHGPPYILP
jgi:hypothetical protein